MPNIVITEGLDTPWTLANTESNITAATDLTKINLANQTIGTLAYTASQLFASLKTEKDNLDNIVDAIDLINEEIALFPEKVAAWGSVKTTTISDNVLGKMRIPLVKNDFVAVNLPNPAAVLDGASQFDTSLKYASPGAFRNSPEEYRDDSIVLSSDRTKLDALIELTAIKSSLDDANIQVNENQIGYLFSTPVENQSSFLEINYWRMTNAIIEGGTDTSFTGTHDQLVVYRDADQNPISYKYFYMRTEEFLDTSAGFPQMATRDVLKSVEVPSSQLLSFAVPKDGLELESWRLGLNNPQDLINATKSLLNNTGLPSGVTPPVTTLGPSVEKYYDKAKYNTTEYTTDGFSTPVSTSTPYVTMVGDYPPIQEADFGFRIITTADIGKIFQNSRGTIFYVAQQRPDGQFVVREMLETTPYISEMTDDLKKTLRGEYAEKQILLTQRGTDQTLFVTSITQRYTTFSDTATNLLKTLVNFYNDLARNLRG